MLKMEGHTVFHYGCEGSVVDCDEHISVTTLDDLEASYGDWNWRKLGFPTFNKSDLVYTTFYARASNAISKRMQPNDFLLCSFGDYHKPVADQFVGKPLIPVEPGIGYPNGAFAPFRVFESYAIMHAYQTNVAACSASNTFWYDAVIPNAFRKDEFGFGNVIDKHGYLLFLGRLNEGKGIHIAKQLAAKTNHPLLLAGPGVHEGYGKHLGNVGPEKRKYLLQHAKATICASTFLEPFCGVQIESMLSGTPVISSDRGAFAEYNVQGKTGFRCRTFEQFEWAVRNIGAIDPVECRDHAMNFTLEKVAPRYTDYFQSVADIFGGKGWYEEREGRTSLF